MMLFDWSNRMIGLDDPEYANEDGAAASGELFMYVNELGKQRASDPRDDIVTKLINSEIEGDRLSELEFDMFMMLLTVAGNETTRNTTSWGMWALMQNPDQYAALAGDMDGKIDNAIEEILRWATPVYHFRRTAMDDTVIGDKEIKKGDKVVMWHISADRDEEVFDDPYQFNIDRFPNEHIAFGGGGQHFCLGANLARMELKLIFKEILERIPDMTVAGNVDILRSNFIGGIKHMPVNFTAGARRNPAPLATA
jgi:cholest-4-en-3-one 26-monooxygenase